MLIRFRVRRLKIIPPGRVRDNNKVVGSTMDLDWNIKSVFGSVDWPTR